MIKSKERQEREAAYAQDVLLGAKKTSLYKELRKLVGSRVTQIKVDKKTLTFVVMFAKRGTKKNNLVVKIDDKIIVN